MERTIRSSVSTNIAYVPGLIKHAGLLRLGYFKTMFCKEGKKRISSSPRSLAVPRPSFCAKIFAHSSSHLIHMKSTCLCGSRT